MIDVLWRPSPNFNARRPVNGAIAIRHVILHYTGMPTGEAAEARLRDAGAEVSAHYLVHEDGRIVQMVREEDRAWHAGQSFWQGVTDLNSTSIGIEMVNPGHEWGYRPFPEAQLHSVAELLAGIVGRHAILPAAVLGHSDIAPARKQDPGELFPWECLAAQGLALGAPDPLPDDPGWSDEQFLRELAAFGYDTVDEGAAITAFQRHFRRQRVDCLVDAECRAILAGLRRG